MLQERHEIVSLVQTSRTGEHEIHEDPDLIRE